MSEKINYTMEITMVANEVAKTLQPLVNASCLWDDKMDVERLAGHFFVVCC